MAHWTICLTSRQIVLIMGKCKNGSWFHERASYDEKGRFWHYLFWKQWTTLKQYANQHGISIIGDFPIFVAYDSADVWANRELFFLALILFFS
jgi:hypothetical protein